MKTTKTKSQPRIDQPSAMDGFQVRMSAWHVRKAREIGKEETGRANMGAGVRKAIEFYVAHAHAG